MFETKLLQTFAAIARVKSFVKAAELLHMTQPGVSQHVARLEEQIGARLILRSRKGAELTPAGEILLRHTKSMFAMFERMRAECRTVSGGLVKLVGGLSSSVIYSSVPARIARYARANPACEISLRVVGGDALMDQLGWGELDFAISTLPAEMPGYECIEIASQKMGVALPAGHVLQDRAAVTLAELADEPFIVVPRADHPVNHDALVERFRVIGRELKVAGYETAFPNVLARVAMGEGIAVVALGHGGDKGSFRLVPLEDPLLAQTPLYAIAKEGEAPEALYRLIRRIGDPRPPSS